MKQKLKIMSILIMTILTVGCSSLNLSVRSTNSTEVKKYSITMANYAIENGKIFIRLGGKVKGSYFRTDSGQRFQIYFVADYDNVNRLSNTKAYYISVNSLNRGGLYEGEVTVQKIKLDKDILSASLEKKLKTKRDSLFFDFSNIEMKKTAYHSLVAMDIDYDKSCLLNKNFSIYTNNKTVGKYCPKGDMPIYGVETIEFNYLSFNVETYAPVKISDMDNIKSIKKSFTIEKINQIYKILFTAKPNARFDNSVVRLKMKMRNGEVIYVDRDGVVVRGDNFSQLDKENFERLKNVLNLDESS